MRPLSPQPRTVLLLAAALALGGYASAEPQLKVNVNHGGVVTSVAVSAAKDSVLSASNDGSIRLWEAATGREIERFVGHEGSVDQVAFLPDGKRFVSLSREDGTLRFWRLSGGAALKTLAFGKHAYDPCFAVSPDGSTLAYSEQSQGWMGISHSVVLLDTGDYREKARAGFDREMSFKAFTPDGRSLVMACSVLDESSVRLVDAATMREIRALKAKKGKAVKSIAVSPDGKAAFVGYFSGAALLWDLSTGKKLHALDPSVPYPWWSVESAAFSMNGSLLAAAMDDGSVAIWEAATGKLKKKADIEASCLAYSPDGSVLVAGRNEGSLSFYDAEATTELRRFGGVSKGFGAVKLEEGGGSLLSRAWDGSSIRWDASTMRLRKAAGPAALGYYTEAGGKVEVKGSEPRFDLSDDGRIAAFAAEYTAFSIVDLGSHRARRISLPWTRVRIDRLRLSPDGSTLAVTLEEDDLDREGAERRDRRVLLYNTATGKQRGILEGSKSDVHEVAFSPDGKTLATGGADAEGEGILLWDLAAAKPTGSLSFGRKDTYITALAFSPDGRTIAAGDLDGRIWILDAAKGRPAMELRCPQCWTVACALDPKGGRLFAACTDDSVRAWDIATGRELAAAIASPAGAWVAWTPEGFFDCSEAGAGSMLYVLDGGRTYGIDQFYERFRRPDLIAARLRRDGAMAAPAVAAAGFSPSSAAPAALSKGFALPPSVRLELKKADGGFEDLGAAAGEGYLRVDSGLIVVRLVAKDAGGGIDGARLFVSGKAVGEDARGLSVLGVARVAGAEWSREYEIPLARGENAVRAVAFSSDRTESAPFEARFVYEPPAPIKPSMWIVAAAADSYRNPRYRLSCALADAKGFSAALPPIASGIFARVSVDTLYDEGLSKEAFLGLLAKIAAEAKPDDVLVIYYAGHGVAVDSGGRAEFYFVMPSVTNMQEPERLAADALSGSELREALAAIPANKQMILVDACNAGALAGGFALRGAAEDAALAQLSRASGAAVISSTTAEQLASEVAELGHGLFTYALLRGLEGEAASKDGRITAGGLRAYVEEELPELSRKYRGSEQYPTSFLFGQDFPVGTRR